MRKAWEQLGRSRTIRGAGWRSGKERADREEEREGRGGARKEGDGLRRLGLRLSPHLPGAAQVVCTQLKTDDDDMHSSQGKNSVRNRLMGVGRNICETQGAVGENGRPLPAVTIAAPPISGIAVPFFQRAVHRSIMEVLNRANPNFDHNLMDIDDLSDNMQRFDESYPLLGLAGNSSGFILYEVDVETKMVWVSTRPRGEAGNREGAREGEQGGLEKGGRGTDAKMEGEGNIPTTGGGEKETGAMNGRMQFWGAEIDKQTTAVFRWSVELPVPYPRVSVGILRFLRGRAARRSTRGSNVAASVLRCSCTSRFTARHRTGLQI